MHRDYFKFCTPLVFLLAGLIPNAAAKPRIIAPSFYYMHSIVGDSIPPSPRFTTHGEAYAAGLAAVAIRNAALPSDEYRFVWIGLEPDLERGHTINGTYMLQPIATTVGLPVVRVGGGGIFRYPECPSNYRLDTSGGSIDNPIARCFALEEEPEPPCDMCTASPIPELVGNPMFPSTGLKEQVEVDYESHSAGGLRFVRTYRSDRNVWEHNYSFSGNDVGLKAEPQVEVPEQGQNCIRSTGAVTGKTRCFHLMHQNIENDFVLQRGNGPVLRFGTTTNRLPPENVNDRWTPVLDTGNKVIAHDVYNARNDSTERYGLNGRLERIVSRTGNVLSFEYVAGADGVKVLHSVTDHFGKSLTFTYDPMGRMKTMTTPNGGVFTYGYDEASSVNGTQVGNLTSVTYPDGKKRMYWYNEPLNTAGAILPFALTGITDENGTRYATYQYDAAGKTISTEHAGGVNKYQLKRLPSVIVTNPLGAEQTYKYTTIFGIQRVINETQPAGSGAPASSRSVNYDSNGNIDTYTDFKGVATKYTYNLDRNLESARTEAFGTTEQRVIATEWHQSFRLPLRVSAPKQRTTFAYYDNGALKSRTEQATSDLSGAQAFASPLVGASRTISFTYNANWQVETVTGPAAGHKVTYAYEPTTGNLLSVSNALGHITRFEEYNGDGQVGLVTQPNGVTTRLHYYPRGWMESMTVAGGDAALTTNFEYDGVGQLTKVSLPGGVVIINSYDAAHRLTDIADNAGNSIHYTLDLLGNRIKEEIKDPSGLLARETSRVFDAMSRLQQVTGAAQ